MVVFQKRLKKQTKTLRCVRAGFSVCCVAYRVFSCFNVGRNICNVRHRRKIVVFKALSSA